MMETTTTTGAMTDATVPATTQAAATAPTPGSWAAQTVGEKAFSLFVFGLSTAVSVAFVYYLITDPGRLTEVWRWTRSLPLLVQGVIWLLALPWMIALWIWTLPWALAIRLVLVVGILGFTTFLMYPFK